MSFNDPSPYVLPTNLSLGELITVIHNLPRRLSKWRTVTSAQLSNWFIKDTDKITVMCAINSTSEVVRCIITPSRNITKKSMMGVSYNTHENAKITLYYKGGGSRSNDLDSVEHAAKYLGNILLPELRINEPDRPLFTALPPSVVPDMHADCNTIEKIWQTLTLYKIPFHLFSQDIHSNIILDKFDRKKYDTAVISPWIRTRKGDMQASIYVSKGSYPIIISNTFPFTSGMDFYMALSNVGAIIG